jgi:hypothetical protein
LSIYYHYFQCVQFKAPNMFKKLSMPTLLNVIYFDIFLSGCIFGSLLVEIRQCRMTNIAFDCIFRMHSVEKCCIISILNVFNLQPRICLKHINAHAIKCFLILTSFFLAACFDSLLVEIRLCGMSYIAVRLYF